jgi:hypothetical protein
LLIGALVSVIRAFRPHVVIALFADSAESDPSHRAAARLARDGFVVAADSVRFRPSATSGLAPWSASRLFTLSDGESAGNGPRVSIDVGEFDRATGRSFAELGAEIRLLQRTQPALPAPPIGRVWRLLRLDATRTDSNVVSLFGGLDTTWARFRFTDQPLVDAGLNSLRAALTSVHSRVAADAPDSLAAALAAVVKRATDLRLDLPCADANGVPKCAGALGDFAVSLGSIRQRAVRSLIGAAGIVIDGTVARNLVALRDSVPVMVSVFNGGRLPVVIRRLVATSRSATTALVRDSNATTVLPDSVARWSANLRVNVANVHWWQINGLIPGTRLHDLGAVRGATLTNLINGEDRIETSGVEATLSVAGVDVSLVEGPLVQRNAGTLRGDARRPLAGVTPVSVLLERTAEYERAAIPIDRLFRVYIASTRATPETTTVSLRLPKGLRADSANRVVILPPFSARNVFFRLRGTLAAGADSIAADVRPGLPAPPRDRGAATPAAIARSFSYGVISRDYPHIPTQLFFRSPGMRLEAVDLRVPRALRVAYVRGTDDVQTPLGQLQLNVQALEPSLLSVVDLSGYSAVLIGAGALENDALASAIASLREYMRKGGTVIVLPGGAEVARSGLPPYPITFDTTANRAIDLDATVLASSRASLLTWPHAIASSDFEEWVGERARGVPISFDSRYSTLIALASDEQRPPTAALLVARVGSGTFIYSALSLDRQLAAVHPGAARVVANLLSVGFAKPR